MRINTKTIFIFKLGFKGLLRVARVPLRSRGAGRSGILLAAAAGPSSAAGGSRVRLIMQIRRLGMRTAWGGTRLSGSWDETPRCAIIRFSH